jgi:hypothetical protein
MTRRRAGMMPNTGVSNGGEAEHQEEIRGGD